MNLSWNLICNFTKRKLFRVTIVIKCFLTSNSRKLTFKGSIFKLRMYLVKSVPWNSLLLKTWEFTLLIDTVKPGPTPAICAQQHLKEFVVCTNTKKHTTQQKTFHVKYVQACLRVRMLLRDVTWNTPYLEGGAPARTKVVIQSLQIPFHTEFMLEMLTFGKSPYINVGYVTKVSPVDPMSRDINFTSIISLKRPFNVLNVQQSGKRRAHYKGTW